MKPLKNDQKITFEFNIWWPTRSAPRNKNKLLKLIPPVTKTQTRFDGV